MSARDRSETEAPHGPGCLVSIIRFLNTLIVVALIAYAAAFAAVRTDGFKGLVKERLEARLGLNVSIGKISSDALGNLTLSTVSAQTTNETSHQGLQLQAVRIRWDMAASMRHFRPRIAQMTCDGGTLVFERDGQAWQPANLAGLGDWVAAWLRLPIGADSNAAAGVVDPASEWASVSLMASNVDVRWIASATGTAAEIRGLAVETMPLATPHRYLRHFALSALYAEGPGTQVRNADFEWIDTGQTNVVLSRREELTRE